jgi:DNA topoisomerase-1
MAIDGDRCVELILAKRKADAEKEIKVFRTQGREDVRLLNGRWGPYLAIGKSNYKLPKGTDPKIMSLDECLALADEQDKNPSPGQRRAAAKKAAAEKVKEKKVKKAPAKKKATTKKEGTTKKKAAKKTTAKKK